ncbi:pre-mRNA-splicing factor 38B-like isoform X2 [Varroa jacobsoni]|uniref:Pre-mRNA-splicing factor 38 n=1 Tax=Varroa destructor TaxID=109461 RepID=A0A7M7KG45_VARDE|nr:pre-mRNA-splicing factor 38B-like isoform X2 [Varroa destructor]XP_022689509.1 pre-mRNA-splicing factor 38B-like isoform X2 [Varroa jacobsoni]
MADEVGKTANHLPVWGNDKTMNLNTMILTNIQGSAYFKVTLYKLKTYHQVIDEIYFNVAHLEPWERGSRKTSGQVGMCGGVRGVGAGGIVSTAFCCLYKLYTLKLTRKQVYGLLDHTDSPYIRALGFMYLRYTQPPQDLIGWFEPYLTDEEEVDPKAGGGDPMTMGQLVRNMLQNLDWYSTLFPRIPVPVQKQINAVIANKCVHFYYTETTKREMSCTKTCCNSARSVFPEKGYSRSLSARRCVVRPKTGPRSYLSEKSQQITGGPPSQSRERAPRSQRPSR